MFEKASRMKLRFSAKSGIISVEDLWDLNAEQLNELYIQYQPKNEGLLTVSDSVSELQAGIIKHVFDTKQREIAARELERVNKQFNEEIDALILSKQREKLSNLSVEELQGMKR